MRARSLTACLCAWTVAVTLASRGARADDPPAAKAGAKTAKGAAASAIAGGIL